MCERLQLLFHRLARSAALVALWAGVAGCPPPPPVSEQRGAGPPRELDEIVATIDANAAKVNRPLWSSSASVSARISDEKRRLHHYNLDGTLLFEKPRRLRMDLRPSLGEPVMGIGSNDDEYWLWVEPELHMLRWGRHRTVGRPCNRFISIRPDQLVAALGVGGLPHHDEALIGPVRRFGNRHDILSYLRREGDAFVLDREYWVERVEPYLIRIVNFRDRFGRIAMSASLDDYKALWPDGPFVPHDVNVLWPQDDSTLDLSIARLVSKEKSEVSPRAFVRPPPERLPRGITDIVQIDRDCDESGEATSQPAS